MDSFNNALNELFSAAETTEQHITDHLTEEYKQEQYTVVHNLRAALSQARLQRENLLEPQERIALDALSKAWEECIKLPGSTEASPWQTYEFMMAIHSAQRIILSKCAKRILGI